MFVASSGLYSFNTHYCVFSFIQPASLFTHIFIVFSFGFFLTMYLFSLHLSILYLSGLNCIHLGCWCRVWIYIQAWYGLTLVLHQAWLYTSPVSVREPMPCHGLQPWIYTNNMVHILFELMPLTGFELRTSPNTIKT